MLSLQKSLAVIVNGRGLILPFVSNVSKYEACIRLRAASCHVVTVKRIFACIIFSRISRVA